MHKVLFISVFNIHNKNNDNGGFQCAKRNYKALCAFFGKDNVETYFLKKINLQSNFFSKLIRLFERCLGRNSNLSFKDEKNILNILNNKHLAFIDSSLYGCLAKLIRHSFPSINIISFFHNVEYNYIKHDYSLNVFRKSLYTKVVCYNEKCACRFSNITIALNNRDSKIIEKIYDHSVNAIIPISFTNREIIFSGEKTDFIPTALFLGSNFYANIHGIKWFIENVLPFVNIKLKIVGKDMDKVNFPKNKKLEVIGYVENLDSFIQSSDFMIFPIFKGSGMKVKTCEALMYGKNIIGTGESFMGYDLDFGKVGAKCETAEEFIKAINEFPQKFTNKFNEYARNIFLEKYSNEVTFKQFAEVFKNLNK